MFNYPDGCREFMDMQVVQNKSDPHSAFRMAVAESRAYRRWLPESATHVLDIGCGLGRTTVMLHSLIGNIDTTYYLLDRTAVSDESLRIGEYCQEDEQWSANLDMAVAFCRANMDGGVIVPVEMVGGWERRVQKVDLAISTLSVGFHWALRPWLASLSPLMQPESLAIFGVRHGVAEACPDGWVCVGTVVTGTAEDFACYRRIEPCAS